MQKTIDSQEVNLRFPNLNSSTTEYDFNFDFEVLWVDKGKSYLKKNNNGHENGKRKIIYIPQNYLNKLSEKEINSNKFIEDILLQQDETIRNKYEKT